MGQDKDSLVCVERGKWGEDDKQPKTPSDAKATTLHP